MLEIYQEIWKHVKFQKTSFGPWHRNSDYHDELLASNVNNDVNDSLELDLYCNEPPISKNKCAIKYWTQRPETPLTKLALKYLCLIATSVPSERLFPKLSQIYTNKRCRLKASNANDLLFLDSADDDYWDFQLK